MVARGCGLLRDSDARRVERQGKTRPEFSAATVGVDRWLKVSDCESHERSKSKNGANGRSNIEGKVARAATNERWAASEFQWSARHARHERIRAGLAWLGG